MSAVGRRLRMKLSPGGCGRFALVALSLMAVGFSWHHNIASVRSAIPGQHPGVDSAHGSSLTGSAALRPLLASSPRGALGWWRSWGQCKEAETPKVALMFLVRGRIYHQRVWAAWLEDAAGQVPTPATCCRHRRRSAPPPAARFMQKPPAATIIDMRAPASGPIASTDAEDADPVEAELPDLNDPTRGAGESSGQATSPSPSGNNRDGHHIESERGGDGSASARTDDDRSSRAEPADGDGMEILLRRKLLLALKSRSYAGVLDAQELFSVYVHTAPSFPDYPADHLFYGRRLPSDQLVTVGWGQHSVTRAMRALLAAAVADNRNQRFMFVDEASTPLFPPQLVWTQFMSENKSRMSACEHQRSEDLWHPSFERPFLRKSDWRKSSQWSMLIRPHAEVLVAETHIWDVITPMCEARLQPVPGSNATKPYWCISDERYYPTVLAAAGLSNQTSCAGNAMFVDWAHKKWDSPSPVTFYQKDVRSHFLASIQLKEGECPAPDGISAIAGPGNFGGSIRRGSRTTCPVSPDDLAFLGDMPYVRDW
eukprot:CAMPEP_0206137708 /NCGR_PEP_ID=MMETSP1473-20131121/2776_1 /ASSEMBLY_ACC=CAM_ASM_001109 /TAXON_ID=1461547 /ORGANISM="Stichococcus sp, Strain RCC1054" /LENGTH=539 /DNA_ID=CAMNT_0053530909 /DNA_START=217 /DNA_END=1833 /DNA_ORIENTATION=-